MSKKGRKKKGKQSGKSSKKGSFESKSAETALLQYLRSGAREKVHANEIMHSLSGTFREGQILHAVQNLINKGRISTIGDYLKLMPRESKGAGKTLEGKISLIRTGAGFVTTNELERDVYIHQKNVGHALSGDIVSVRLRKTRSGARPEGEVVEVLRRRQTHFVGTIEASEQFAFLICDSQDMPYDIFIPNSDLNKATTGDKAVVEITGWEPRQKNPKGKVTEVLGKAGSNEIEMKAILINNGFQLSFPEDAKEQAMDIGTEVPEEEIAERMDYREILTFTIDPEDAKDFDDALSFRVLDNNNYEIGVHIADVSHYIKPGSPLDREAFQRSTSVYLPDRVCPMFPEKISNVVCSLRPNETKLCFAAIFEFDRELKLVKHKLGRTAIHSDRRFAYMQAQEYIEKKKTDAPYGECIPLMDRIAKKLKAQRFKDGSINFDTEEVRFKLNEEGHPIEVYTKQRVDAHMMIEDFMLLANRVVAKTLSKWKRGDKQIPSVYRVHEKPDTEKLANLAHIARSFGHDLKLEDTKNLPRTLNKFMEQIHGKPEQHVLESLAIRSMSKAIYTTQNVGHFGLGFEFYTHFTSPIRRYPDVMVHRILEKYLAKGSMKLSETELEEICQHNSEMERKAQSAEWEAISYMQVLFLQDKIGEEFNGLISGVIGKGVFVELEENKCEGFIETSKLGNESFLFDEMSLTLTGVVSGASFRVGNRLQVQVESTDLERRRIEFDLVKRLTERSGT